MGLIRGLGFFQPDCVLFWTKYTEISESALLVIKIFDDDSAQSWVMNQISSRFPAALTSVMATHK